MKIYAIRDRLIDYFKPPFIAPDDKTVMASLAQHINSGDINSDIAQAPHHFEIHSLGTVTDDGAIEAKREFVADCSSLIRPGVRQAGQPRGAATESELAQSTGSAGRNGAPGHPNAGPVPPEALRQAEATAEVHHGPRGGYPPRNGQ